MSLTEIKFHHYDKRNRQYWLYKCDCGNEKIIHRSAVNSGNTKSCGCLKGKSRILDNEGGTINQIILQYKRHARNRNIEYHLSREQAEELFRSPCHYCGDPHGNLKKTKNNKEGLLYNGIDRLDNSKGYIEDNVVPCCGTCNITKGRRSKEEFLDWIKRIYNRIIN